MITASPSSVKTLVLGLGNDLLGDDAVGVLAARRLQIMLAGRAEVQESALHGLALLDTFLGYDRALILDAIHTGRNPPGTIIELTPDDLRPIDIPSPHFAGLPEMIDLARQMQLPFPLRLRILAVEIQNASEIGGPMTPAVKTAIDTLCSRAAAMLDDF